MVLEHDDGLARREFLRRGAALGIGGSALTGLLAACGSTATSSAGSANKVGSSLSAWAWQPAATGYPAVWQTAGARWEAMGSGRSYKYTSVDYTDYFTKFKTADAGGQPPDLLEMAWSGQYRDLIQAQTLQPLDDLLSELPKFFPNVMDTLYVNGKTYAIPQDVNTLTIAYNKQMFKQLGLQPPATLDELLAMAKPIRAAGKQPLSLAVKDQWPSGDVWFAQLAYTDTTNKALTAANNGQLPWNASVFAHAAEQCQRIAKSGILCDGASSLDTPGSIALFGQQHAAMLYPAGNFLIGLINAASGGKFDYDLFPFPPLDTTEAPRATGGAAVLWSIASNAKNPAGARQLIKLLTDAQTNQRLVKAGFFPASPTNLSSNTNAVYQKMASYQTAAASRAIFSDQVYTALLNSASAVLGGTGSASSIPSSMKQAA